MTLRRIDLLGPPGAGKSTLYRHLAPRLEHALTRERAYVEAAKRVKVSPHSRGLSAAGRLAGVWRPGNGFTLRLAKERVHRFAAERLADVRPSGPADGDPTLDAGLERFIRTAMSVVSLRADTGLALQGLAVLTETLNEVRALDALLGDAAVVSDASLCHRVYATVGFTAPDPRAAIERYFRDVPAPALVLCLTIGPARHRRRVAARTAAGVIRPDHRGCSPEALEAVLARQREAVEIGLGVLSRRGVPCFEIEADASPDAMAERAADALERHGLL